jgi:hypothetical protein
LTESKISESWDLTRRAEIRMLDLPAKGGQVYARVASFEGGDNDRLQQMNEERMQSGEMQAPEGMKRAMVLADREANTRLFVAFFDSREQVDAASARFEEMGDEIPEDVRGRRTSVDVYEVVFDQDV